MDHKTAIDKSTNQLSKSPETITNNIELTSKDFFVIGRPCGFTYDVDPDQNIKKYMLRKMNIIDLIPCTYEIQPSKVQQDYKQGNMDASSFMPKISYDDPINRFGKIAELYKLQAYKAIRLFITDETQNTDQFDNTYAANIFQNTADALSEKGQQIKDAMKYFQHDLDWNKFFGSKYLDEGKQKLKTFLTNDMGMQNQTVEGMGNIVQTLGNIILRGTRVSFPRIWSRSEYKPNLVANIKLVSPYGDKKAIKEFIIKPLMYLLMLASPVTDDGITYGFPNAMTVRAYGLSMMGIASISSISLRRGGNDTSFNIYRQPLEIDVSVAFENLVSGFSVANDEKVMKKKESTYDDADKFIDLKIENSEQPLMTTLGKIIDSLRPFNYGDIQSSSSDSSSSDFSGSTSSGNTSTSNANINFGIGSQRSEEYNIINQAAINQGKKLPF